MTKAINPQHYKSLGVKCARCGAPIECIHVAELFGFNRGNVIKYIWRAGLKGDAIEDLKKARWYIDREIRRLEQSHDPQEAARKVKLAEELGG